MAKNKQLNLDAQGFSDKLKVVNKQYRYRSNGKKVSDNRVYQIVAKDIAVYEKRMLSSTKRMFKTGNFEQWQKDMSLYIKEAHISQMRLGRGGKDNTFPYQYLYIHNKLRFVHYPALQKFAEQITEGELSEKQILNRVKFYARASRASFEFGKSSLYEDGGSYMGRRHCAIDDRSCPECVEYARRGWVMFSQIVYPTEKCSCLMNCRCTLEIKTMAEVMNQSLMAEIGL